MTVSSVAGAVWRIPCAIAYDSMIVRGINAGESSQMKDVTPIFSAIEDGDAQKAVEREPSLGYGTAQLSRAVIVERHRLLLWFLSPYRGVSQCA